MWICVADASWSSHCGILIRLGLAAQRVSESFVCGSQPEIKEELTKQMPGIPISALATSALLVWLSTWLPKIFRYWIPPLLLLLIAVFIEPDWTVDACRLYGGQQHDRDLAIIRDAQALTTPGGYVMDAKGETIFRRRPYYYAF
jgi:hypothetical protein